MLGFGTTFVYVGNPTKLTCVLQPWLLSFAFALTNGALLSKTWRIYRIFGNNKKLAGNSLTFFALARNLLILALVEGGVLAVWTIVDPPVPAGVFESDSEAFLSCSSTRFGGIFMGIMFGLNGLLLLAGTWLAYQTRNVDEKFRESAYVALIMYNTFIWSIIAFALVFLKQLGGDVQFIIRSVVILMVCFGALVLLFGPKFKNIYMPDGELQRLMASSHSGLKTKQAGGASSNGAGGGATRAMMMVSQASTTSKTMPVYCRVGTNQMFLGTWMGGRVMVHEDKEQRTLIIIPTNPEQKAKGHCVGLVDGKSQLIRRSAGDDWGEEGADGASSSASKGTSSKSGLDHFVLCKLADHQFYELQFDNRSDLETFVSMVFPATA
ncbi:hypothetical protein HK101_010499 [Irineochytrium annulatum]|nr:hypothetical protein HK101_010499 [Irineochytrium annulatum]